MADDPTKPKAQPKKKGYASGDNVAWFIALIITLPYTLPYMAMVAVLAFVCIAFFKIHDWIYGAPEVKDPKVEKEKAWAEARAKAKAEGKIFLHEVKPTHPLPPDPPEEEYNLVGSAALLAKFRAQRAENSKSEVPEITPQAKKPETTSTIDTSSSSGKPRLVRFSDEAVMAGAPAAATSSGTTSPPMSEAAAPLESATVPTEMPDGSRKVTIAYGSQTGTASEIARNIHAECTAKGLPSQLLSFNELGFANVSASKTPIIVFVISSTGDGDPPDNAGQFWVAIKRKHLGKPLQGIQFACLGLGDSNYTRFMNVSRTLKAKFEELGATRFYRCEEADEVDGIEEKVDPWVEGLFGPLKEAMDNAGKVPTATAAAATAVAASAPVAAAAAAPNIQAEPAAVTAADKTATEAVVAPAADVEAKPDPRTGLVNGVAPLGVDLSGVPALAACRVRLLWEEDQAVETAVRAAEAAAPSEAQLAYFHPQGCYSPDQPFWATVSAARVMTADWSDRRVLHLELDISGSGMEYQPGDSLGLLPCNSEQIVDGLLARLGVDGQRVLSVAPADGSTSEGLLRHLRWPCTLRSALLRGVDLTSPARKSLLRLLAEAAGDEAERRTLLFLASRAGRDAYAVDIMEKQPNLLDLLNRFPSCEPAVDALLDALPPLAPRMYSIASSRLQEPNQAHIAFSVVRSEVDGRTCEGVATSWLDRICQPLLEWAKMEAPVRVPVYLKSGGSFRLPASLSAPLIMIGPGTGVAPFRGFLQHRRHQIREAGRSGVGAAFLFFGCRREDEDCLYRDEFKDFVVDKTLQHLHVATSRAQADKVYVQDLIREHGEAIALAIASQGAYVYVCGDGAKMSKDVHACLTEVLQQNAGLEEAGAYLQQLAKDGRYVRDIWSA